jgi:hypothetical protein
LSTTTAAIPALDRPALAKKALQGALGFVLAVEGVVSGNGS